MNDLLLPVIGASMGLWSMMNLLRSLYSRKADRDNAISTLLESHTEYLGRFMGHPLVDAEAIEMAASLSDWAADPATASSFLNAMTRVTSDVRTSVSTTDRIDPAPPRDAVALWANCMSTAIDLASVLSTGSLARGAEIRRLLAGYEDLERTALNSIIQERRSASAGMHPQPV